MEFETVKAWLVDHTNREIRRRRMMALLGLILTPFATVVGGILIYSVLFLFRHRSDRDPDIAVLDLKVLLTTVGILAVMFAVNALVRRKKEPEKLYSEEVEVSDSLLDGYVQRQRVVANFFLWIALTGPRLFSWSLFSFREISRLKNADLHGPAALLWLMLAKRAKVPYDSVPRELPWLDLQPALAHLQHLPGIVFLKSPPAGISMTDDLRSAIRNGTAI
ncbi:MAG TPA: hypothetical protein VFV81_05910 [Verrucomicrobiae bacterium]|nr:hypothetical protein [Verrucomicrobiae bacterium]